MSAAHNSVRRRLLLGGAAVAGLTAHMVVRHCREMGFDVRHRYRRETLRIAV